MAGSKTAYLEGKLLNFVFNGGVFVPVGTLYAALSLSPFDTSATGTVMDEVPSSGAYARVSIVANTTNFPVATGSNPAQITNGTTITFPTATGSWGTVLSVYLVDAATLGNTYYGADLAAPVSILTGASLAIPPSAAVFQET